MTCGKNYLSPKRGLVYVLAAWDPSDLTISWHCVLNHTWLHLVLTTATLYWLGRPSTVPTNFIVCWTWQLVYLLEHGSLIAASLTGFIPSFIDWTFLNMSIIRSESQCVGVFNTVPDGLLWTSDVSSRQRLLSVSRHRLVVPWRCCNKFGHRTLQVADLMTWT